MAYGKPIVAFDLKETRFSAGDAPFTRDQRGSGIRKNNLPS